MAEQIDNIDKIMEKLGEELYKLLLTEDSNIRLPGLKKFIHKVEAEFEGTWVDTPLLHPLEIVSELLRDVR